MQLKNMTVDISIPVGLNRSPEAERVQAHGEARKHPRLHGGEITRFLSQLKQQERDVEEKRQHTLRQLERLKKDIQRSIKQDREARMHLLQHLSSHIIQLVPANDSYAPTQDGKLEDVLSVTSGTSSSSNSLTQHSQFINIPRPHL